jgi:hypothetical protein
VNVLVGCERYGRVRDAFRALGHNAYSVDIERDDSPYHVQDDVRNWLDKEWDLAIFFPPCTYLTTAGNAHLREPGRRQKREDALDFVRLLLDAPIPRIALENPVGVIGTRIRPADQYIEPCYFGDPWWKKTGLWLENLPPLYPTKMCRSVARRWVASGSDVAAGGVRDPQRRQLTFQGIADAMAMQWGGYNV